MSSTLSICGLLLSKSAEEECRLFKDNFVPITALNDFCHPAGALSPGFALKASCNPVSISLGLTPVKPDLSAKLCVLEGRCAGPEVCPLSRVEEGTTVCIKQLSTEPDVTDRLRELGFIEEQKIKLVARESSFICQVCNARLGISRELAEAIWVEALPAVGSSG